MFLGSEIKLPRFALDAGRLQFIKPVEDQRARFGRAYLLWHGVSDSHVHCVFL
jgi:hypothetical protein